MNGLELNVFKYEMIQNKKSIITWSLSLAVSAFLIMSGTGMFTSEASAMKEMLGGFPDEVLAAMGIDFETFFSVVGFYSYAFLYLGVAASIQAMNLGLGVISKETRMKTADFLMTKPKRRYNIFIQKFLSAICSLLITEAVFFAAVTVAVVLQSDGDFSVKAFVLINLTFFLIQMMYMAIGLLIAALMSRIKSTVSVTMGVCFGTFLLGMISAVAGSEVLRFVSPLKYFDNNHIMLNKSLEPEYLAVCIALTVIAAAASFIIYVKKDIAATS